ncbi:helix-turn-helix domain-containing protein [Dyadobacter crusticola]|uniref:helix-turn-helix domain-containing protein n=1 Tax=Dyadobacter crusticola TaxID=292407 RepID=UPI0004E1130A|nr:AraC family transcriptional regulator [Dyadobacter crusticola]
MRISYQNELIFPEKCVGEDSGKQLYRYYEQSEQLPATSRIHWFDFHTTRAHTLHVSYPEKFYKMVLCIAGKSQSAPRFSQGYEFSTGQALFYQTDVEPYKAALPADTRFKIIHIHLSEEHIALLASQVPMLFDQPVKTMRLSEECAGAFLQLKNIAKESPGLLRLFEEKLITDQLFGLATQLLPRQGRKDILQEAIWHIHQADRYLTIAELAQMTGTNTFRIKQVFRDELHTSVFQYQSEFRLERAARLLLDTSMPVHEVAIQCGYESPAAFSNAFTKKHGIRPQAFKNSRARK